MSLAHPGPLTLPSPTWGTAPLLGFPDCALGLAEVQAGGQALPSSPGLEKLTPEKVGVWLLDGPSALPQLCPGDPPHREPGICPWSPQRRGREGSYQDK